MPVHDWTRVTAGTFHHFHNAWIVALSNALNGGVLPEGYDALGEQHTGDVSPDVLALHAAMSPAPPASAMGAEERGMIAVAEQPPQVTATLQATTDAGLYLPRRRTLVIYHTTGIGLWRLSKSSPRPTSIASSRSPIFSLRSVPRCGLAIMCW